MKKIATLFICLALVLNLLPVNFAIADSVCTDNCCTEHNHQNSVVLIQNQPDISNAFLADLDSNNSFTVADLILLAKQLISFSKNNANDIKATDINGDYKTSVVDLVRFKKHIAYDDPSLFTYVIENNEVTITGCKPNQCEYLTIPFEIDGWPVTKIAADAFNNCYNVEGILIPSSIKDIGDNAFGNCSSLKSIALPDSVYTLGKNAFSNCENIASIRLSDNITVICESTFSNCSNLKNFILPDDVEEIGESAFYLCSSLIELNIPQKVTVLNDDTFYGCTNLIFIGLPENLKEIKCYTFYGCEKLQSISIPITVINVGDNAFDSCVSLLSVVVPYETAFGTNVFTNCPVLVVEGFAGAGGIDAAINSGANYELMDCGHAEFILLNAKNPTCTQVGFSGDQYCIKCGKIEQPGFEVAKTGHITELKNAKAVTCTQDGYTGDTVCKVCSHTLDYGWPIYCEGHFAKNMPGYIAPTCTQEGIYGIFTCEKCGEDINNEIIPATDHDKYYANRVDADCKNDGYSGDYMCFICKEIFEKGHVLPKGEHNYEQENYKYATCTQEGYTGDYVCTGCGDIYSKGKVVQKRAHDLYTTNYKAATCTENGFSGDSVCIDCKQTISEGKILPLLGHKSVLINYRAATCTQDGYSGDQICSVCKVFVSMGNIVEKTGHQATLHNYKEATDTETGYTGDMICDICGVVTKKGTVTPVNHEHIFQTVNAKDPTCSTEGYTGDEVCSICNLTKEGSAIEKLPHDCTQTTFGVTCTQDGYVLNSCKNCDYEYKTDIVPALQHISDEEWTIDSNATCTQSGSKHKNCSRCGEVIAESIAALGHTFGEVQNALVPTCTESGYSGDRTCSVCSATEYGHTIDALGHNCNSVVTAPTCTKTGYTTYTCKNCSYSYIDDYTDIIPHTLGEPDNKVSPTCTESGYSGDRKCIYCDYVEYGSTIDAIGHNYTSAITAPGCTSKGFTTHTCTNCSDSYTDCYTEPTGHTLGELINVKAPTCTEDGYTGDRKCANCDYIEYGEAVSATGHNYTSVIVAPTCSAKGFTKHTCDICSYSYNDDYTETIDHVLGELINVSSPTCDKNGYTGDRKCANCDYVEYGKAIGTTAHSYTSVVTAPTCIAKGYTTYTCQVCSASYVDNYTSTVDHNYVNGSCTVCNKQDLPEEVVIESKHPYASNSNEEWTVNLDGASALEITFSADTDTESNYDFISIYDENDNLVYTSSGTALASKTITIDGDYVKITLTSDGGIEYYGFTATVRGVFNYCSECGSKITYTVTSTATCMEAGTKTAECGNCGTTDIIEYYADHSYTNGMCDYCYCSCMHEHSDWCEGNYSGYYHCYDCNSNICYSCGMIEYECFCGGVGDMCPNCCMPKWECMCGGGDMCPMCGMPKWECMCGGEMPYDENM